MSQGGQSSAEIVVKCACGKSLKVPAKFAGKAVKCPACQQPLTIPAAGGSGGAATRPAAVPAGAGELEARSGPNPALVALLDEAGITASRTGQRCPSCKQDIATDAVICVHCGFNLETGKQLRGAKPAPGKKAPRSH
ncbi:MAG: hypothetical protein U0795_14220 [Pirellulales bacterium]